MPKNISDIGAVAPNNPPSTPFFSIGVTTYNRPDMLKQTLRSIIVQTFPDFEVIIGNDYNLERLSKDFLNVRDPRIRIVNHPQNLGEAQNMNTLLSLSRGRYFTWQCDDDLYAPNFLAEIYSSLIKFQWPACVFTSYEFIYGTSDPDPMETVAEQGRIFTGREFLRMYWAGKLKAMGCTGVYEKDLLKQMGGVQCLTDTSIPLYSEHLLLVRAGLQAKVAHIDEPLIKYRIHDAAWGCTAKDLLLYRQACHNLIRESLPIFSDPKLRRDFRRNIASLLKFVVFEFFCKARAGNGWLSRHWVVPFYFSLIKLFNPLRGTTLYASAILGWGLTGIQLSWWLCTKFNIKAVLAPIFSRGDN